MRELVSYAIAKGNLSHNPLEETGADVIGALARVDPLGAALWRVVGQHDLGAFKRAIEILTEKLKPLGVSPRLISKVCFAAIEEWMSVPCPTCLGRCFTVSPTGVRATCWDCKGNGRGTHSPEQRMSFLGVGRRAYAGLVVAFEKAHVIINAADGRVNRQLSHQLERQPRRPAKPKKGVVK